MAEQEHHTANESKRLRAEAAQVRAIQTPVVVRKGDASSATPVLSVPNFYGAHGHNPDQPDMFAFFAALGPDVKSGRIKTPVRTIDLAPTVEKLFGVEPAETVDGRPLPIFKDE